MKSVTLSVCTQLADSSQPLYSEDSDSVSSSLHSKSGSASVTSPALVQPGQHPGPHVFPSHSTVASLVLNVMTCALQCTCTCIVYYTHVQYIQIIAHTTSHTTPSQWRIQEYKNGGAQYQQGIARQLGGMLPQEMLKFRPSEMESERF